MSNPIRTFATDLVYKIRDLLDNHPAIKNDPDLRVFVTNGPGEDGGTCVTLEKLKAKKGRTKTLLIVQTHLRSKNSEMVHVLTYHIGEHGENCWGDNIIDPKEDPRIEPFLEKILPVILPEASAA